MIDKTIIGRVAEFNFLGLTLDENPSWKSHVSNISKTLYPNKKQYSYLKLSSIITSKFWDTCLGLSMC